MWAVFPESLRKKVEERSILKKSLIRIFTLSLALSLVFSTISYEYAFYLFQKFQNNLFLPFVFIITLSVFIGSIISFFVFGNIFLQIRRIIQEVSTDFPRWEMLEQEYIESDIRSSYLAIKKLHLTVASHARYIGVAQLASQVAHDIRSPLTALELAIKDITNISEELRILIRNAINRVYDIANNLLLQYKSKMLDENIMCNKKNPELIADLLLNVLSEKRVQYKNLPIQFLTHFDAISYYSFALVSASEFKRVISNLLNNAVEALEQISNGTIDIILTVQTGKIYLTIRDNGCGMSSDFLQQIVAGAVISQKENGNGLGLSYALKTVEEEWEGQFCIQSDINEGTKIDIILNLGRVPAWFKSDLSISPSSTIVVLDDDESIHSVWQSRFNKIDSDIKIINFYDPNQILIEYKQLSDSVVFLIDYEFIGYEMTGLDVIRNLNIGSKAYLVTSGYEDHHLQKECEKLGVKIIPKNIAPYFPIHTSNNKNKADLIILDDNQELATAWILHGIKVGKSVVAFNTINEFKSSMMCYEKNIPIYIDFHLNESLTGLEFSKELYEKGFTNLYIASACSTLRLNEMPWIKGLSGKEPPFIRSNSK
jgi:signal transduction histidine kinase